MRFGQPERDLPSGEFACDIRPEGFSTAEAARIFAVREHVRMSSLTWGIPPWRIYGTIWVESRFRPYARSSAGAMGLMQLMPGTWTALSRQTGGRNPFDPLDNIMAGSGFLAALYNKSQNIMRSTDPEYRATRDTVVKGLGFEPTPWQLAHASYFAGMAGALRLGPQAALKRKVLRYVNAVEKASARFKALEPFCEGKPEWDAPAPHRVPVARRRRRPAPAPAPVQTQAPAPAPVAAGGGGVALLLLVLLAALGGGL